MIHLRIDRMVAMSVLKRYATGVLSLASGHFIIPQMFPDVVLSFQIILF